MARGHPASERWNQDSKWLQGMYSIHYTNFFLWKDAKSSHITPFLHLEWNLEISHSVPRHPGSTWSVPAVPFHLLLYHRSGCHHPPTLLTFLLLIKNKNNANQACVHFRPFTPAVPSAKMLLSSSHMWILLIIQISMLPPLRPSLTSLPKIAHATLPAIFTKAFTTTWNHAVEFMFVDCQSRHHEDTSLLLTVSPGPWTGPDTQEMSNKYFLKERISKWERMLFAKGSFKISCDYLWKLNYID